MLFSVLGDYLNWNLLTKNICLGIFTFVVAIILGWKLPDILLTYWMEFAFFALFCFIKFFEPAYNSLKKSGTNPTDIFISFLIHAALYLINIGIPAYFSLLFVYLSGQSIPSSFQWWQLLFYPLSRLDAIAVVSLLMLGQGMQKLKIPGISALVIPFERLMILLCVVVFGYIIGTAPQSILVGLAVAIIVKSILDTYSLENIMFLDNIAREIMPSRPRKKINEPS